PAWLGNAGTDEGKNTGTLVFSFTSSEDAAKMISLRRIFIFGELCSITRYEERAPIWYCKRCGSISHSMATCRNGDRCKTCSVPVADHETENHPIGE
ncbi:hypothetical protein BS47DRAFT_1272613, partial [Hydnum rufescens UP504]